MKSNEIEETRGTIGPIAIRALAVGAQSIGAIAVGAVALSAVAIGFIAIGRLVIGHAKIKRLEIGELRVTRLHVTDSIITPPNRGMTLRRARSDAPTRGHDFVSDAVGRAGSPLHAGSVCRRANLNIDNALI